MRQPGPVILSHPSNFPSARRMDSERLAVARAFARFLHCKKRIVARYGGANGDDIH